MPHIHEKIDFTAEVFIVYNNKVLLRKHDKYGIWLSVGGHIELNEDPNKAAIREVKEEVGLDIKLYKEKSFTEYKKQNYEELIPPQFMNRHRINQTHEHITLTYFAKATSDELTLCEDEKSSEVKWFSKEELDAEKYVIDEHIKNYAKSALTKLKTN